MTPVPVRVSTNPPFSLDPALHLPDARHGPISHHNGTSGPALHLPDSPPYHDDGLDEHVRDHGHAHEAPLSQLYAAHAHEAGRGHGGYTLPPFKFSHPHSPIDGVYNGNAHEHAYDTHNSWRPYAESERGPSAGAAGVGMGTL